MNTQGWKSYAQWPAGTIAGSESQISEDTHTTREQAEAICRMLRQNGFGGDGRVFPVRVWFAPEPHPKQ